MSTRRIVKIIKRNDVKSMADIGSGYDARLARLTRQMVNRSVVVDVSINSDLIESSDYETHEGFLPEVLTNISPNSLDLVVMNAVVEHLEEPILALDGVRKLLNERGILFVNVPSWFGKRPLEILAFRLNLSPADGVEDHKRYYNKRELWVELRSAGFMPSKIKVRRHKLGCAIFAVVGR